MSVSGLFPHINVRCYEVIDSILSEKNIHMQGSKLKLYLKFFNQWKNILMEEEQRTIFEKLIENFEKMKQKNWHNITDLLGHQGIINDIFDDIIEMRDKKPRMKQFIDEFLFTYTIQSHRI